MLLVTLVMRVFEAVFLAGVAGSAIVVAISFVEDFMDLMG